MQLRKELENILAPSFVIFVSQVLRDDRSERSVDYSEDTEDFSVLSSDDAASGESDDLKKIRKSHLFGT